MTYNIRGCVGADGKCEPSRVADVIRAVDPDVVALQEVDVGQGPLERWFGMASVRLRSAAATTDASIPGLPQSDVEGLRRLLMQRAGRDDGT